MKENEGDGNSQNKLLNQKLMVPDKSTLKLTIRRQPLLGVSRATQSRNVAALLEVSKTARSNRTHECLRRPRIRANPSPILHKPSKYTPSAIFKAYIREVLHAPPTAHLKPSEGPLTSRTVAVNGENNQKHESPRKTQVEPLIHLHKRTKKEHALHTLQRTLNGTMRIDIAHSEESKLDRTVRPSDHMSNYLAPRARYFL